MPRLGSSFFNAYNDQKDNLRRRRGENVEAFNSFVKMRTELGETASVSDMEKMRNNLAGGEGYFMNALPTGAMLQETNKRLIENQADERAKEQNQVLSNNSLSLSNEGKAVTNVTNEIDLVSKITSSMLSQDPNAEGGFAAIEAAFEKQGQGELFKEYADLIPSLHNSARLSAIQNQIEVTGFDALTTTQGWEANITNAPDWMKAQLSSRGENNVLKIKVAKIKAAKENVIENLSGLIDDADGDTYDLRKIVVGQLKLNLGEDYTSAIADEVMLLAAGAVGLDQNKRERAGLAQLDFDDTELLGAQGNDELMRQMAVSELAKRGVTNPREATIDTAVAQLKIEQRAAVRTDFVNKVGLATAAVGNIPEGHLKTLSDSGKVDAEVMNQLAMVFPDFDSLSDPLKAEAITLVKAALKPRASTAVNIETASDTEAVVLAIGTDAKLKQLTEGGKSKDKLENIYKRINEMRRSVGLAEMSDEDIKTEYGSTVDALLETGASARYSKEVVNIQEDSSALASQIGSSHTKTMEIIAGSISAGGDEKVGQQWAMVAQQAQLTFLPKSSSGYAAFQDMILALMENGTAPPTTAQEAMTMASQIATASGWVPASLLKQSLMAEMLNGADLIEPGTPVVDFLEDENDLIAGDIEMLAAQIRSMPRDSVTAAGELTSSALEIIDTWTKDLTTDMNSTELKPLLQGLDDGTALIHESKIRTYRDKLIEALKSAKPSGQYSFMTHLPDGGDGLFIVSSEQRYFQAITDAQQGFIPGATYKKIPNPVAGGLPSFEIVLNAPSVTENGDPIVNAGNMNTDGVRQVDPSAAPLVQDVQTLLADSDITRALSAASVGLATGDYGPGTSYIASAINYIFGSSDPSLAQRRELNVDAQEFIRTRPAKDYLLRYPQTIAILKEDPAAWFLLARDGMPPPDPTQLPPE
tara:strand:- start:3348 stop:6128 length:2781 start_codon:yes stop_codon:yes gene_type:complete